MSRTTKLHSSGIAQTLSVMALTVVCWMARTDALSGAEAKSKGIDFGRQIRPILSDNCFTCHGPDEKSRKAGLRLDVKEEILKPAKSGKPAIIPGKPEESELVKRIETHDEDDVMPPKKSGKTLTSVQRDLLKKWIAEGAPWISHWAYEPPKRPTVPSPTNARWSKTDIDRFILARLEKEGLSPSKSADKTTLIRRVTLDLTGLPPTPAEVDAFLSDTSPDAYNKVVDRLLQSPHYGEHMAKFWLDAARYADSHGYHIDSERSLWKYRDWVVNAFNKNMPFDQFTVEQLAGDLLPNATLDQKVASGYVRSNMSTGEGGAIVEEYQAKYSFDRTETTGTIWLGLTMTCARCHTHKYDPILQKEYYGLLAFFNNLHESVMDGNVPNPDPAIQVPTSEEQSRLEWLRKSIAQAKTNLEAVQPELDSAQARWEESWKSRLGKNWAALEPQDFHAVSNTQHRVLSDFSVRVEGPNPPRDVYQVTFPMKSGGSLAALRLDAIPDADLPEKSSSRAADGKFRLSEFEAEWVVVGADGKASEPKALKFARAVADAAVKDREIEKAIDGKADTGWQPTDAAMVEPHSAVFVLGESVTLPPNAQLRVRLKSEASEHNRAIGRFRISRASGDELASALIAPKPEAWRVLGPLKAGDPLEALQTPLEPETKLDLTRTFPGVREEARWSERKDLEDGKEHVLVGSLHGVHGIYYLLRRWMLTQDQQAEISIRGDDVFRVWLNGEQVGERKEHEKPGQGPLRLTLHFRKGENQLLVKLVNVQGDSRFRFEQFPLDEKVLPSELAAAFSISADFTADQKLKLRNYFRRVTSPEWRQKADLAEQWKQEEEGLNRSIPTTLVAKEEMEKPRETFTLMRGEYDKIGEKVSPGVPSVFPPFPKDAPTNRLGLARWLLMPNHPLTARVTVNRFWQQCFGVGIVKTVEDFGVQGDPPSHPELLDWLATEFIQSGWDVKHLQRLIVTSAVYQQSSQQTAELHARDPENRLLARGPRFRVDGEVVRDSALAISGLLVEKLGGKSVKPYEPPGLWEAVSFNNSQKYVPDEGEAQYRRSLYTHWKRQSPPPNMLIFDAPTREYCVVRRPRTNTPLQALALLNDPQFVEAARAFADRVLREGGKSTESRLNYAFRLATARKPKADELKVLQKVLEAQLKTYAQSPEAAQKLLSVGSYRAKGSCTPEQLAAWSTVASMILNLDETVTKI